MIQGSKCPFCDQDFGSRARVRNHLSNGKQSCMIAVLNLPVLDAATVMAEGERERAHARNCRRQGRKPDARAL